MMYFNKPHCGLYTGKIIDGQGNEMVHIPTKGKCCVDGKLKGKGICAAVVDDVNGKVYLYGNVVHENYHVPGSECFTFTAVESAGFETSGRIGNDEVFTGVQVNNSVILAHLPLIDHSFFVFLNGLKQIPTRDYSVNGQTVTFTSATLGENDVVEIMYEYEV